MQLCILETFFVPSLYEKQQSAVLFVLLPQEMIPTRCGAPDSKNIFELPGTPRKRARTGEGDYEVILYGVRPQDFTISTNALGPEDMAEEAMKMTVINVQHLKSEEAGGLRNRALQAFFLLCAPPALVSFIMVLGQTSRHIAVLP